MKKPISSIDDMKGVRFRTYNPMTNPAEVNLKHDRIQYWVGVGAQPTETVKSLIKHNPVKSVEEV